MSYDLKALIRRTVTIDFEHKHRHLPGSLSALPIIADIYEKLGPIDCFLLSKGHACAALYAVLESKGFHPDVSKVHPERDPENGIEITAGSLGHGLPIAVGRALAHRFAGTRGTVHVLIGDGEALEGTTWEALHIAKRFLLEDRLRIHCDCNHQQGAGPLLSNCFPAMNRIFPVTGHFYGQGHGVPFFEARSGDSVHALTPAEYKHIMESLK